MSPAADLMPNLILHEGSLTKPVPPYVTMWAMIGISLQFKPHLSADRQVRLFEKASGFGRKDMLSLQQSSALRQGQ